MTKLLKFSLLAGLIALVSVAPAFAQSTVTGGPVNVQLKFTMPNAFYVQNTKMPAGTYVISQGTDVAGVLLLRSQKGNHEMYVEVTQISNVTTPVKHDQVTFSKYNNKEFLSEIWLTAKDAASAVGWQVLPTANEKAQAGTPAKHSVPSN